MELGEDGLVGGITAVSDMPLWENGGYFVLRQEVFDHIPENGDLVADGCAQLAKRGRLVATGTAASGGRPTPSRSGPRSTRPTPGATARGPCGSRRAGARTA